MTNVVALPTRGTLESAWDCYAEMVRLSQTDPSLALNLEHQIATARAWAAWRDLFLASDRRAQC